MTVLQPRCVWCKREQSHANILGVSIGKDPCAWCRRKSIVFATFGDYRDAFTTWAQPQTQGGRQ
jgi:hypothetical protein